VATSVSGIVIGTPDPAGVIVTVAEDVPAVAGGSQLRVTSNDPVDGVEPVAVAVCTAELDVVTLKLVTLGDESSRVTDPS
jgi:hypothetical protein